MNASRDTTARPPGTILLQDLRSQNSHGEILLEPRPSSNPNDPLNWPRWRKYLNFGLVTLYVVMVNALINAATPTWGPMQEQLGFSDATLNNSYAIGCGMLAVGAFVLMPFALKFGRRPVYLVSTLLQFGISIWSAKLQTAVDLLLINAFSCFLGALFEVIVQLTVADVFFVHERGTMNGLFVWTTYIGAKLTPVVAGSITVGQGWRWVWWWTAIFFAITFFAMVFLYEETKFCHVAIDGVSPVSGDPSPGATLANKNEKEKDQTNAKEEASELDLPTPSPRPSIDPNIPLRTYWQRLRPWISSPGSMRPFARHSYQPFLILFSIPAVFFTSLVYGGMMAASDVIGTTLSTKMTRDPYNFNAQQIGMMNLAPWIGSTIGSLVSGPLSDWLILFLARRNKGVYEPEMRLWIILAFLPCIPTGIFLFGIGLEHGLPWPLLAVGYGLCLAGIAPTASITLTYITDAYTEIVGDSLVGVTFTRNLVSTIFIFALDPWIEDVGAQNVFVTIGVLLTAIILGTAIFLVYGKKLRVLTVKTYRYYAGRQFDARKA
ncbi:MFS general substrate transporter [Aspergillus steynii IBT 23096]|uniref:MFS general substrate transporter n=1 Tax=Aspergillus steynii IBT 23096 TaxID=1392250 RepID=A0A2I2GES8_9EURO|nr:MFS general substrate transporter [Aspergillus steynii IBT 23096]PLB51405.1 MFS general substrate transporter [Aspergillus steynii IBT 23096]